MSVKLLTEHHLEFLRLKGGCTGWSESIHVKMPHCWKSRLILQAQEVGQLRKMFGMDYQGIFYKIITS